MGAYGDALESLGQRGSILKHRDAQVRSIVVLEHADAEHRRIALDVRIDEPREDLPERQAVCGAGHAFDDIARCRQTA